MHYHGPIIRPQTDANSIFLEVTAGCTHDSCTFCNFYQDTPFWVAPLSQIEEDLQEAKEFAPDAEDIWLSGGNPYALAPGKLAEVGKLVRQYYPDARVSTYARIDDFFRKSLEDIKMLNQYIDEIMIGIETGDDEVLKFVNKGYTAEDIVRECQKLDEAGQTYRMIYLGGLAGAGKCEESARRSARVLNQIHPYYMILTNVAVLPGTELYEQMQRGEFTEASELERIKEIRTLIGELENEITINTGTSASSIYFVAHLPGDKKEILKQLNETIAGFTREKEEMMHSRRASMRYV